MQEVTDDTRKLVEFKVQLYKILHDVERMHRFGENQAANQYVFGWKEAINEVERKLADLKK